MRRSLISLLTASLLLAACSGDDSTETTTSTTAAPLTSLTASPTTSAPATTGGPAVDPTSTTSSTVTVEDAAFPTFTIKDRIEGAEGDTLVILIDPDFDDGTITDIDLQNLLSTVVEDYAPVREAYVVSSEEAAGIVLLQNLSAEQEAVLDQHFWARLEDGFRIVFQGPFAGAQPLLISS